LGKRKEKKNSRGSGKWDDAVTERTHPRDAQLRDRDALTVCYGRQAVHELKVMSDVLGSGSDVSRDMTWESEGGTGRTSSWKRLYARLKSPGSKSLRLLI
jgi:hypothetical protein